MTTKFKATDENGEVNYRSPFWKRWRERPEFDSRLGYYLTDMDVFWGNIHEGFIIGEHKCRGQMPTWRQTEMYIMLDDALSKTNKAYRGAYCIVHDGEDATYTELTRIFKLINRQWVPRNINGVVQYMDEEQVMAFLKKVIEL